MVLIWLELPFWPGKYSQGGAMYDVATGLVKFYTDTLIVNSSSVVEMAGEPE